MYRPRDITKQDFIRICSENYSNGSFIPLFRGEDKYAVYSIYADIPTDWDIVIRCGIYEFYLCRGKDKRIKEMCYSSLIKMLKGTAFDVWCAANVIFIFANKEARDNGLFTVVDDHLVKELRNALLNNKNDLMKMKTYTGKEFADGLWQDTLIIARLLKSKGVNLRLEDNNKKAVTR